ncbi:kinase-like protein [Ceraceosorus guamensis]|uniref:Kinase-like protein n=1 Tax=Ceraceosorus guamensis TaxID=1522189 RepID=A0A316W8B9_9BASI|nr:kinase-like protein [Ceraceosorus guamensis]PWN46166.1 kinase-like protein [Ceraceosorus guamensis]
MTSADICASAEDGEQADIVKELWRTSSWLRRYETKRVKALSDEELANIGLEGAGTSSDSVKRYYAALLKRTQKHSSGLCSSILRVRIPCPDAADEDLLEADLEGVPEHGSIAGWAAIKVVSLEEQPPPHDVFNEYRTLSLAVIHRNRALDRSRAEITPRQTNVVHLISAFVRAAGPWSKEVALVLPLYPCTLAEALRIPADHIAPRRVHQTEAIAEPHLGPESLTISPSSAEFALKVTKGVLSGLNFLHSIGVAHRDIKPSNVLLSYDGEAILADLGVATRVPASHAGKVAPLCERPSRTAEVGTTCYRPPELLFSPSDGYDGSKADVWSAGASLIELWTALVQKAPKRKASEVRLPHWETALADDQSWQRYSGKETKSASSSNWSFEEDEEETYEDQDHEEESELIRDSKRQSLFDGRGEIALAGSIFAILGRPTDQTEWPESEHFSPPLSRMPFPARKPVEGGLRRHLAISFRSAAEQAAFEFCESAIRLSAGARPSAADALARLGAS